MAVVQERSWWPTISKFVHSNHSTGMWNVDFTAL